MSTGHRHHSAVRSPSSRGGVEAGEEFRQRGAQRHGEAADVHQRHVPLPAFDGADVVAMQPRALYHESFDGRRVSLAPGRIDSSAAVWLIAWEDGTSQSVIRKRDPINFLWESDAMASLKH